MLNLLRVSVGADVQLGGVHLEIRGVEAQVLLKVLLNKIAEIINRELTTVDRAPDIPRPALDQRPGASGSTRACSEAQLLAP